MTERETTLWTRYLANGKLDSDRDAIFSLYCEKSLVERIAMQVLRAIPPNPLLQHGDLCSYGFEALLNAIPRFDPARGVKFTTFAGTRIRGAMKDGIRKVDWVPRREREQGAETPDMVSLDALTTTEDSRYEIAENESADAVDVRDYERAAVRHLDHRQRRAFRLIFLERLTLKEVGMRLGISATAASSLRDEIVARLLRATGRDISQEHLPCSA